VSHERSAGKITAQKTSSSDSEKRQAENSLTILINQIFLAL